MTAKRALTRMAATIAASAVPPASKTSASANCADPENTTTDETIGRDDAPAEVPRQHAEGHGDHEDRRRD